MQTKKEPDAPTSDPFRMLCNGHSTTTTPDQEPRTLEELKAASNHAFAHPAFQGTKQNLTPTRYPTKGKGVIVEFSSGKWPLRRHSQPSRASLRKAIDQQCKDCIYDQNSPGGWRQQVEACTSLNCSLFPVRPLPKARHEQQ